jgi:hypothetical protein
MQLRNEALSVSSRTYGHDFEEKLSQVFSICTFGVAPTPHGSLSLDVHETALNEDLRPQHFQDPDQMAITVEGNAVRY